LCRSLAEGLQKDKIPGLPVFATALRCLPYVLPESWDASRIATELPGVSSSMPLPIPLWVAKAKSFNADIETGKQWSMMVVMITMNLDMVVRDGRDDP